MPSSTEDKTVVSPAPAASATDAQPPVAPTLTSADAVPAPTGAPAATNEPPRILPLHERVNSEVRAAAGLDAPVSAFQHIKGQVQRFLERHGRKIWWLHSIYALVLGMFVVSFAQKGFQRARLLAISLVAVWFVVVYFFRVYGTGAARQTYAAYGGTRDRLRFLVMTYVLKNLYQSMLFFLLPFYWKAATLDSPNVGFSALLTVCAVLSTLDIIFDHYLMRWRTAAGALYSVTLFAGLNLLIPAIFPNTRTLYTLLTAAAVSVVAFWALHVPVTALRDHRYKGALAASIIAGVLVAYVGRAAIPPVPMYLRHGAVGPSVLPDGRLAMEVSSVNASVIRQLLVVTDVVVPGGHGDRLRHIWRHDGRDIERSREETSRVAGPRGTVRLRSALHGNRLPARLVGPWSVDVETEDGQLVGRVEFTVTE